MPFPSPSTLSPLPNHLIPNGSSVKKDQIKLLASNKNETNLSTYSAYLNKYIQPIDIKLVDPNDPLHNSLANIIDIIPVA